MNSIFSGKYLDMAIEKSGISNLERREKWALLGGAVFLVAFLVVQFVITPFFTARENLEQAIDRKERELATIQLLQQEHQQLKKDEGTVQDRLNQRNPGFTLFTFLDQQARQVELKEQISYMKPSKVEGEGELDEAMVEMKFQGITLEALVKYLLLIESEENVVFLRRISIQESGREETGYLDVIMQIITFEQQVEQ